MAQVVLVLLLLSLSLLCIYLIVIPRFSMHTDRAIYCPEGLKNTRPPEHAATILSLPTTAPSAQDKYALMQECKDTRASHGRTL